MSERRAHCLDHLLGQRMVATHMRERRKSDAEVARMDVSEQARYLAAYPKTDAEKYADMKRKLSFDDWEKHGELDPQIILDNEPPPDWGVD
jgi:hypothetical protein